MCKSELLRIVHGQIPPAVFALGCSALRWAPHKSVDELAEDTVSCPKQLLVFLLAVSTRPCNPAAARSSDGKELACCEEFEAFPGEGPCVTHTSSYAALCSAPTARR